MLLLAVTSDELAEQLNCWPVLVCPTKSAAANVCVLIDIHVAAGVSQTAWLPLASLFACACACAWTTINRLLDLSQT